MRTRKALIGIIVTALLVNFALIYIGAYYIAIALEGGILLIHHREFWSLIKTRELPPFDERIKENIGKSVRNGFLFLIVALAFFMLPFPEILVTPDSGQILDGLLLSGGAAYLLSFVFFDRVRPNLGERGIRVLRIFLFTTGISVAGFTLSVFLHNALSGLFIVEPIFFFISRFLTPLGFIVGIIGSLAIFIQGLLASQGIIITLQSTQSE